MGVHQGETLAGQKFGEGTLTGRYGSRSWHGSGSGGGNIGPIFWEGKA